MPQQIPQPPRRTQPHRLTARRAPSTRPRRRRRSRGPVSAGIFALISAIGLAAGLPAGALGQTGRNEAPPETALPETAASEVPQPAPVPAPPDNGSEDEALIELPIAPAGPGESEPAETGDVAHRDSEGVAGPPAIGEPLEQLRVLFPADGSAIDDAAETDLLRLAGYLSRNQEQRVVLRAHAGESAQGSSHARRLSLSRALAIRTFLVDQGVPENRIFLRPLGSQGTDGPPDRVDISPLRP